MNTAGGPGNAGDGWTIVIPVKTLEHAKSRLASSLSPADRRALVVAMATDVITACRNTQRVGTIRVVGADPEIAQIAADLGAEFVVDATGAPTRSGETPADATTRSGETPADAPVMTQDPLNTAIVHAMSGIRGPIGVIAADLPELDSRLLTGILEQASRHQHSIVTDHRGRGTTMAFWTGSAHRESHFGAGSAERFRHLGGAVAIAVDSTNWGAAARDVDTPEDVAGLVSRRVGPATERALRCAPTPLRARDSTESVTMVR